MENLYLLRIRHYLVHLSQLDPHKVLFTTARSTSSNARAATEVSTSEILSFSDFQRYLRQLKEDR